MMKQKKYQLAAWTVKSEDGCASGLRLTPSLHLDMQEPYFKEIGRCYKLLGEGCNVTRRLVNALEQNADFLLMTGYHGDGIRMLRTAARRCVMTDEWAFVDTDLGNYDCFFGKMKSEFFRLHQKFMKMIDKYGRQDILTEKESMALKKDIFRMTEEDRDLAKHLREMKAWE